MKRIIVSMLAVAAAMLAAGSPAAAASCNGNAHDVVLSSGAATPGTGTTSTDQVLGPLRGHGWMRTHPGGRRDPGHREISAQRLWIHLRGRSDVLPHDQVAGRQPSLLVQRDEWKEDRRAHERRTVEGGDHRADATADGVTNTTGTAADGAASSPRTSAAGPASPRGNGRTDPSRNPEAKGRRREPATTSIAGHGRGRIAVRHGDRWMVAGHPSRCPRRPSSQCRDPRRGIRDPAGTSALARRPGASWRARLVRTHDRWGTGTLLHSSAHPSERVARTAFATDARPDPVGPRQRGRVTDQLRLAGPDAGAVATTETPTRCGYRLCRPCASSSRRSTMTCSATQTSVSARQRTRRASPAGCGRVSEWGVSAKSRPGAATGATDAHAPGSVARPNE